MKQQRIVITSVALLLTACPALTAQSGKSSVQRFDDGIYEVQEVTEAPEVTVSSDYLVSRTTQSSMYVNPTLTDTLVVPDLGSFNKKVNSINVNDSTFLMPVDSSLLYSMVPAKNRTAITVNSTWSVNFGIGPFWWGRPWYWDAWAWSPWYGPWRPWPYDPWYRPWPYHPYGPYHPYRPYPVYPGRSVRHIDSHSPNSFASGIGTQTGHRRSVGVVVGSNGHGGTAARQEVSHAPRSSYGSGLSRSSGTAQVRGAQDTRMRSSASETPARRYSSDGYNVAVGGSGRSSGYSSSGPVYRRSSGSAGSERESEGYTSGRQSVSGYSNGGGSRYSGGNNYSGGSRTYNSGGYSGGGGGGYSGGGGHSGGGGFSGGGGGHRR